MHNRDFYVQFANSVRNKLFEIRDSQQKSETQLRLLNHMISCISRNPNASSYSQRLGHCIRERQAVLQDIAYCKRKAWGLSLLRTCIRIPSDNNGNGTNNNSGINPNNNQNNNNDNNNNNNNNVSRIINTSRLLNIIFPLILLVFFIIMFNVFGLPSLDLLEPAIGIIC